MPSPRIGSRRSELGLIVTVAEQMTKRSDQLGDLVGRGLLELVPVEGGLLVRRHAREEVAKHLLLDRGIRWPGLPSFEPAPLALVIDPRLRDSVSKLRILGSGDSGLDLPRPRL